MAESFIRWSVFAHIIGMRPPNLWSWVAALALFGGLVGVVFATNRPQRLACVVLALAGLAGSIDDVIARSSRPARPDLVIRLVSPPRTPTDPVVIRVCGTTRNGRPTAVTVRGAANEKCGTASAREELPNKPRARHICRAG